jgi:S-adenosylmethionine:tRNA ribosyltransferase-isomerase
MKTGDFNFDLPPRLIAQYPEAERGASRLMVLDRSTRSRGHYHVKDLPSLLEPGSLLVFNNSKVRKGRIFGVSKETGARVEFLLVKKTGGDTWKALVQRAKRRRPGSCYVFHDQTGREIAEAEIIENGRTAETGELRLLRFDRAVDDSWLDTYGHIPLPPYIKREDTPADSERYQTVYAETGGFEMSAAAPTAGLHFTGEILSALEARGVKTAFVTLHVGLGTFLPVRTENIEDHVMHEEVFSIGDEAASMIESAKSEKRKIVAVGTTSVRTLESAWDAAEGKIRRGEGSTSIFIYPGYTFKAADALFTNFHTPESTLLMLASAFAGREFILESYAEAVREGYRFFSYGDAMLIR